MRKIKLKLLSFVILVAFSIVSLSGCRDDLITPAPEVIISDGAYVLSEGGFTAGTSKLSYYNLTNDIFTENIFGPSTLGLFPDGLVLSGSQLYALAQGNFGAAGTIYALDTSGMVQQSQPVGTNPFSLAIANDKIYVTNGPANNVTVVNKNNLTTIATIPVGLFPQEILSIGNKVFVCNTSVFMGGTDSTVSVIDATNDQVVATIRVRQTPSSLAVTNDGKLLVGCPGIVSTGIIYLIDPQSYVKLDSFSINTGGSGGFDRDIAVDKNSNDIYFLTAQNNVSRINIVSKSQSLVIPNFNAPADYFYGYNYDSENRKHYIANAKDFVSSGRLEVYDESGNLIKSFVTGAIPRRIVVKN